MTREEYNDIDAINYSTLSLMHKDPRKLLEEKGKPGRGRIRGSTVDCLVFSPDEFNNRFYLSEAKLPSEKMLDLLDRYLELTGDNYLPINEELVMAARADVEYATTWGRTAIINRFQSSCEDYLNEVSTAGNRTIIDQNTLNACTIMANDALTNKFTHALFTQGDIALNQPAFVWKQRIDDGGVISEVLCKGTLDNLTIGDLNGDIVNVNINDGKYSSQEWKTFERDFDKWNYHLQPPMYTLAINSLVNGSCTYCDPSLEKILLNRNVKIVFNFVIFSEGNQPLIYEVPSKLLSLGFYGGMLYNGNKKKGINQLIKEYLRHKALDYYDYPWDIYDNGGRILLSIPCAVNMPIEEKVKEK